MSGKIAILKKIQSQKQILHAVREAKLRPNTSKNPPSEVSVERNHSRRDGWDSGIIKFSYQQSAHGQEFGARVMSLEQYHDQCEAGYAKEWSQGLISILSFHCSTCTVDL